MGGHDPKWRVGTGSADGAEWPHLHQRKGTSLSPPRNRPRSFRRGKTLAHDPARDDSDQLTHELGRFEAEPTEWDSIGTRPPEVHNDPFHEEVADTQVLPRLRIVGSGGGPSGNDGSSTDTIAVEGQSEPGESFPTVWLKRISRSQISVQEFCGVLLPVWMKLTSVLCFN